MTPPVAFATVAGFYNEVENAMMDRDDSDYIIPNKNENNPPGQLTMAECEALATELNLPKCNATRLVSFFKRNKKNIVAKDVKSTFFRNVGKTYEKYFTYDKTFDICYCNDIRGLMSHIDKDFRAEDYRLFADSNKKCLNVALIHNGNKKPSVPIAISMNTKEDYNRMKFILKSINYEHFKFKVIADFKMISILCGLQLGYPKYPCVYCLFDRTEKDKYYTKNSWKSRCHELKGN